MSERKQVFLIGEDWSDSEGKPTCRTLIGARGVMLSALGATRLPTPPGFAISAEACAYYARHDRRLPPTLWDEIREHLRRLTTPDGARFGSLSRPLLLCLYADASHSPTASPPPIRNIGLSDRLIEGFARHVGSRRAAWDAYRRLLSQFGPAAAGLPAAAFETERRRLLDKYGAAGEFELDEARLEELCDLYKRVYFEKSGRPFPQDPMEQLRTALLAAYARWLQAGIETHEAKRRLNGGIGLAVIITIAVFGQLDDDSAVVRAASRDGQTGADTPTGVYLPRAQEEDLNTDERVPRPLEEMNRDSSSALRRASDEILAMLRALEKKWRYPQQAVFVVERGRLWITECATAPRTGLAAIRWALEMGGERTGRAGGGTSRARSEAALRELNCRDIEELLNTRGEVSASRSSSSSHSTLLEALRTGAREGTRHPYHRILLQLNKRTRRLARLRIWADARDPTDIRLARRLQADGLIALPLTWPRVMEPALGHGHRAVESCRAAAGGLPLFLDLSRPEQTDDGAGKVVLEMPDVSDKVAEAVVLPETAFPDIETWPMGAVEREDDGAIKCGFRLTTPRAALLSDHFAERAAFLIFDLSALTYACLGVTKDGQVPTEFDTAGVGQLVEMAARKARAARHDIRLFAAGISPSDVAGLRFMMRAGFDGVTAVAVQVPAMRLAAAQAALR